MVLTPVLYDLNKSLPKHGLHAFQMNNIVEIT